MAAMEATVGTLTDQLNDFSGEIARLLKIIEDNDAATKQSIQTEITGIQTQISIVEQTYQTVKNAGSALDNRVAMTEASALKNNADLWLLNEGIVRKMKEIDQFMGNMGTMTKDKSDWEDKKPIMEYKVIGELDKLTNDKVTR